MTKPPATDGPCTNPRCKQPRDKDGAVVCDPLYTGPEGHCPRDWCFECFVENAYDLRQRKGAVKARALWMLSEGFTQVEVAEKFGVHERTIRRWKKTPPPPRFMSGFGPCQSLNR